MAEGPTDWRVAFVLDRRAIVEEIDKLVRILARQRVIVTISASRREDALKKAEEHLQRINGIPMVYVKAMHPRKLPT